MLAENIMTFDVWGNNYKTVSNNKNHETRLQVANQFTNFKVIKEEYLLVRKH